MEQDKIKEIKLFRETPVWKALLRMAAPAAILMLIFGMFTFTDNILCINFADDSYEHVDTATPMDSKTLVRMFMAGLTPVTTFILAVSMLFGVGLSTRFSINVGSGREERAIKTLKTTMQTGLLISFLLIPVLLFTAKPWVESQYTESPDAPIIAKHTYDYLWIMIVALPLQMFNQMISALFRAEGKNKIVMIALIGPVFLNILLDWLFMGPGGMNIAGSALATVLTYFITTCFFLYFIIKKVSTRLILKNMFGKTGFQLITLVGVCLVGISPFLRNMAQSITQTVEMSVIQSVSSDVYRDPMMMQQVMSGVFPVFGLFFPMLFAFIQAGTPLAGYNYGAKDIKRVKQTVLYVALFSSILGLMVFSLATFVLINPLNDMLGIHDTQLRVNELPGTNISAINTVLTGRGVHETGIENIPFKLDNGKIVQIPQHIYNATIPIRDKAQKMLGLMMLAAPIFGVPLAAMTLFNSTDRIAGNIISSTLRGAILLIPFLFAFKAIAHSAVDPTSLNEQYQHLLGNNSVFSNEFTFWWFYPSLALTTVIILFVYMTVTMKRLSASHTTLDERIEKVHTWAKNRRLARKNGAS